MIQDRIALAVYFMYIPNREVNYCGFINKQIQWNPSIGTPSYQKC